MKQQVAINQLARKVKAAMGVKRVHRIRATVLAIPENANTAYVLLRCDDEPNYDTTSDGTNIAECEPGSRLISVQLVMTMYGMDANTIVEWNLHKNPDQTLTASETTVAALYAADVEPENRMLRKNTFTAGHFIGTSNHDTQTTRVRIARKAMKRNAVMADNDQIAFTFANLDATDAALLYIRGRLITRST